MHRNPVKRSLVQKPEQWAWSSFRHYLTGETGVVEVESNWTAQKRGNQLPEHLRLTMASGPARASSASRLQESLNPDHLHK
jgi:putative transposase